MRIDINPKILLFVQVIVLSIIGCNYASGTDPEGGGAGGTRDTPRSARLVVVTRPADGLGDDKEALSRAICEQLTTTPLPPVATDSTPLLSGRRTGAPERFSIAASTRSGWNFRFEQESREERLRLIKSKKDAEAQYERYLWAGRGVKLAGVLVGIGVTNINAIPSIKDKEGAHITTAILGVASACLLGIAEILQARADSYSTKREQADKDLKELFQDWAQDIAEQAGLGKVEHLRALRTTIEERFGSRP